MQEPKLWLDKTAGRMDLTGWVKILVWGYTAEVYGRDNDRVMIDRETGFVITRYKFREETINSTLCEKR